MVRPQQLTPLEIASGIVVGPGGSAKLPAPPAGAEPLEMLERATLDALKCPPCLVAFSGGRDSSIVLAAATRAARREGLPLPIPITERVPKAPETDESEWQELVIASLNLPEWRIREVGDEQELLGPISTSVLLRHGLLWPPNIHAMVPMLTEARGGTLLTGLDGDMLFEGWGWARALGALTGKVRRQPRDVLRVAHVLAPSALRRLRARHSPLSLPWLRPQAQEALDRAWTARRVGEPRRFATWLPWWTRMRYLELIHGAYRLIADDAGAKIAHPLLDESFLAAVARKGGISGFGTRAAAMRTLFGGVLPDKLLARCDKPGFGAAYWGERTRDFTDRWDGEGVDPELVDAQRLREAWSAESPLFCSATLVQSVWLTAALSDQKRPTSKEAPQ